MGTSPKMARAATRHKPYSPTCSWLPPDVVCVALVSVTLSPSVAPLVTTGDLVLTGGGVDGGGGSFTVAGELMEGEKKSMLNRNGWDREEDERERERERERGDKREREREREREKWESKGVCEEYVSKKVNETSHLQDTEDRSMRRLKSEAPYASSKVSLCILSSSLHGNSRVFLAYEKCQNHPPHTHDQHWDQIGATTQQNVNRHQFRGMASHARKAHSYRHSPHYQ